MIVIIEDLNEKKNRLLGQYFSFNSEKSKNNNFVEYTKSVPVLNDKERQVIHFKYIYAMNYKEISELTAIKEGKLRSMINNIINKLIDYVKKTPVLIEDLHELFGIEK